MISSFKAEGYRLFDNLELCQLSQVNLIVGDNNSGKSALLEALWLYFSDRPQRVLMDILEFRQENKVAARDTQGTATVENAVRHLFSGHRIPEDSAGGIRLSCDNGFRHITTALFALEDTSDGYRKRRTITREEAQHYALSDIETALIMRSNEDHQTLYRLDQAIQEATRFILLSKKVSAPCLFIPTKGLTDKQASSLWDSISLTEREADVVKGLQLIEPEVTGITFVETYDNSRVPLVKLAKVSEPIPLKSLGDGLTKVFHTALAMVCAKGGVLIVDEFENGLHWSVQTQVWQSLFTLAQTLKVQVFCSTHSRDCIASFGTIWQEQPNLASFHRLNKKDVGPKVTTYDLALLQDSLETEVEVR